MLSQQDTQSGVDFTGVNPVTGADLNNAVNLSEPVLDTASEGKSYNLWTVDSALDTPIVPDATVETKWKRYIWLRILHSTATSHVPIFYAWDDNIASDPTFLKWQRIEMDTSVIEADIAALTVLVNAATNTANNAATVAAAANTNAALALTNAATALATANTANANATQALIDAADAIAQAAAAQVTANTALTNANSALTIATNALNNSEVVQASRFFTSIQFALVAGVVANTAHSLPAKPKFMRWVLVCIADDAGYSSADADEVDLIGMNENGNNLQNFQCGANADNVFLVMDVATVALQILHKTTGNLTNITIASWEAKCYAWVG